MINLRTKMLLFALLFNIFLALGMMCTMEGCTVQVETEPIAVELHVDVTAGVNCKDLDPLDYLEAELCFDIDINTSCCEINWSEKCNIYLCETCIGLSEECYEQEE